MRIVLAFAVALASWDINAEPRLVVLVAVDQLRADRMSPDMPGGLGRLMREGFAYTNATLDHALTATCPGHVAISTGVNPNKAGITYNSFIDHQTMEPRYCLDDSDPVTTVLGDSSRRSPKNIKATTLGDWLKETSPRSKVFSVSGKDRTAIAMAGKKPDGAFWFNVKTNGFTTSGYYMSKLPGYVSEFNGTDFFVDGFGEILPPAWNHPRRGARADDYVGEMQLLKRASPHPLNSDQGAGKPTNFYQSPYLDLATAGLAKSIIEDEELGQRGVTDLLAIGFSATDTVGHTYGPFSSEAADALIMLDDALGRLMVMLDVKLDRDYVLVLTSDHGVMPLPEYLVAKGEMACPVENGRVDRLTLGFRIQWHLSWEFKIPPGTSANLVDTSLAGLAGVVVNERYAKELGVAVEDVVASLEGFLEDEPYIEEAWTVEEILTRDTPMARLYQNSYVPGQSAHVIAQLKETCLVWFFDEGTSHGSPYLYDRHIPMVFYGAKIAAGSSAAEVHSVDIAPTLSGMIGVKAPAGLDGIALELPSR